MITEFGKALRKLRIEHGEVVRDMARRMGVSPSFISAVENGKKNVPDAWIKTIAELYDLNDAQINELREMAQQSMTSVKIDLLGRNASQRKAALIFARDFGKLSDNEADQIISLLQSDSKDKGG